MAKVWFVRRENRPVALGGRPAYETSFEDIVWPLDIGVHRFQATQPPAVDAATQPPGPEFVAQDMVWVELTPADVPAGSSYRVGFYSSPYSPKAAVARLGEPWAS